ncbi:diguanylate cyclase domain-containing protein [Vibrio ziniensis]|uniref:Diguanylate cyclase n=1 Tax=Vibrio ziniensis TaxID=2711221 RepID=A0A6G7CPX6_9VIBR|nr:diguanylate cyclase [Vibrio ziniensis]
MISLRKISFCFAYFVFGHSDADEARKPASERLLSLVHQQDIVARLSGDGFVIVINRVIDSVCC